MNRYKDVAFALALKFLLCVADSTRGYVEVWRDDFLDFNTSNWSKGMTYDRDPTVHQKWNRETGGKHLLNDKYAGYNMDDNVKIWDGILYLRNEKENITGTSPVGNFEYTTGWINSLRKRTISPNTYLEIRAKFPVGPKVWPAIWLVPDSLETWPPEIDIWEYFGTLFTENVQDKMVMRYIYGTSSTVTNYGTFANVSDHSSRLSGGFNRRFGATSWHVYGWEWTPTIMVWYIDDVEVHRKSRGIDIPDTKWPDTDFALIINNGLLSKAPTCIDSWSGSSCTTFPNTLAIDYIKINQCIDDQYPFYVNIKHGKQDCDFIAKQDNKSSLCEWTTVRQKCPITCSGQCTPPLATVSPTNSPTACIDNPEDFYFGKEMKKRFGTNLGNCELVAKPKNKPNFCQSARIRTECPATCEECIPKCIDHPYAFYFGTEISEEFGVNSGNCEFIVRHESKETFCQVIWIRNKCPLVCDACSQSTHSLTVVPVLHPTISPKIYSPKPKSEKSKVSKSSHTHKASLAPKTNKMAPSKSTKTSKLSKFYEGSIPAHTGTFAPTINKGADFTNIPSQRLIGSKGCNSLTMRETSTNGLNGTATFKYELLTYKSVSANEVFKAFKQRLRYSFKSKLMNCNHPYHAGSINVIGFDLVYLDNVNTDILCSTFDASNLQKCLMVEGSATFYIYEESKGEIPSDKIILAIKDILRSGSSSHTDSSLILGVNFYDKQMKVSGFTNNPATKDSSSFAPMATGIIVSACVVTLVMAYVSIHKSSFFRKRYFVSLGH